MIAAEAFTVSEVTDIALHVRGAGTEREVEQILFQFLLDKAEGALIVCGKGVI